MAQLNVRLDDDTREAFDALARARGLSASDLARSLIATALGRDDPERGYGDTTPVSLSAVERRSFALQYEILARLRDEGLGSQPPVVYRALDFLVRAGFVHRVETLNAFVACSRSGAGHAPAFLICRNCRTVIETPAEPSASVLAGAAQEAGFAIETAVSEAEGLCAQCRGSAA